MSFTSKDGLADRAQPSDLALAVDRPICEAQAHVLGPVEPVLYTGYTARRTGDTVAYRPRFIRLFIGWVAAAALIVGLAYAAISAYWALGGTWLLTTVSSSLVTAHQGATVMTAVWAAVVLKAVGALLPFYVSLRAPPSKRHRQLRLLAWAEGAVLTLYGLSFTAAGLLVQAGVVHRGRSADQRALVWHAYLWDPWFLLWGLLVVVALAMTPTNGTLTSVGAD